MTQSSDQLDEYEKKWWKEKRFAGISDAELRKIQKDDKEIADAQPEIEKHVKAAVEENPGQVFDEEAAEKVEKAKAEKIKKIYSD